MNIFENFNKAKQKFGENLARQAIEAKIPNQFVYAACKFNVENGTPFNDLYLLFSQWTTYVVSKNTNINVDVLDYNTFWKTIQDYKKQYGEEGKVYDDGTVSITHISSLEQMKKLPIKNLWCIRREKHWNEYQENGARFYLITNNNYSDESNCRYVMVEMYANGEIGYWSTDNELIDAEGSTKRLPPLAEYQKTLGDALQKIQELQRKITENKQYTNMNKKLIRLTESDLHRIVKESVNRILREASYNINSPEYKQMYDNGNRWPDEMDDTALTNREISDYEALPDRARHPYGQDFPNFSDRIANRAPVTPKDKLASKRPNSVLDMQNKKRALNGMDSATAEHRRRLRDKEDDDMIKYGYAGY